MEYYELWNVLNSWRDEFTSRDFARTFHSPDADKVLHDMEKKGMLARVAFGRYKVRSPNEYLKQRTNLQNAYSLLNDSGKPYALTDVDGVFVWTKGGYNIDRFFGFYPIHVKVRDRDKDTWKQYLASHGHRAYAEDENPRRTLFGVFYVLHPRRKIESETIGGIKVEPLKKVVEFAKKREAAYQPALEMLDEMYHLKLGISYAEANTNYK